MHLYLAFLVINTKHEDKNNMNFPSNFRIVKHGNRKSMKIDNEIKYTYTNGLFKENGASTTFIFPLSTMMVKVKTE